LKTNSTALVRSGWSLLTDVPGWTGAPPGARWRQALPILLPVISLLLLAAWKFTVADPRLRGEHASHEPLFALENEVGALRAVVSDSEAGDLRQKASGLTQSLLIGAAGHGRPSDQSLEIPFRTLEQTAAAQGWKASFRPAAGALKAAEGARIGFLPATAQLLPEPNNARPWPTLLLLLDQFSSQGTHIDLTRVAIRADEEGNYSVEANLRLAYMLTHEKIAQ
jgi:hypothetical protein